MKQYKKVVVKVGTKVITSKDRALDKERVRDIVRQIADLRDKAVYVLLVTSGAIAAGMWLAGAKKRPTDLCELQAMASIGQGHLMHLYGEYFKERGYLVGQMLLTQEDFNDRKRYLNIKQTIDSLLRHRAIPIINENDTVATEEIKCGDNDRLSCLVSDLCQADKLIILTDVDGLLDEDGFVISEVEEMTPRILKLAGKETCDLGTGGMAAKIGSVGTAIEAGIDCVIANGRAKDAILKALDGEGIGTTFRGRGRRLIARKRWIAYSSRPKGEVVIDDGAKEALGKNLKSLLASGIISVGGSFKAGDVISIVDRDRKELARGVVSYSSEALNKIKGLRTAGFKNALGYRGPDEVVHKDNLVIL